LVDLTTLHSLWSEITTAANVRVLLIP